VTIVPIPASAVHHAWEGKPRVRNKNGTSSNWGGYALETSLSAPQNNAVSDVKGQWTVPSVTASTSPNTYSSIWVGIDGYSDGSVEQTGTEQDWSNGHPVYYAWFEMYPKSAYQILNFPVNSGDTVATEVQYNGNGSFKLTIVNAARFAIVGQDVAAGTKRAPTDACLFQFVNNGCRLRFSFRRNHPINRTSDTETG